MKERGILFSDPMVRAILDGRKTQTRRIIKPQPTEVTRKDGGTNLVFFSRAGKEIGSSPIDLPSYTPMLWVFGPWPMPGDLLWVRETWGCPEADLPGVPGGRKPQPGDRIVYRANEADDYQWSNAPDFVWRPSIFMPKWACRLWLRVTDVRVERVQEIDEDEAQAEGMGPLPDFWPDPYRASFEIAWDSLNAKRGFGWDANPWVWVISFEVIDRK